VGAGLPTAMVVASVDADFAMRIAEDLASPGFRTYVSTDIIGVEIGGAVKNVLAIATGIADGMALGLNARAALITRGLNEMTRLGVALGARERTFMGLAGLGDLVLTCTDDQSRNRRCGLALARGLTVDAAMREIGQVVEGYHAARVLRVVARRLNLDMPICEGLCRILFDGANAGDVVRDLMARPPQAEFE
jgi:glycerol-3-phosphate dehydrogenase (NAD(P)+)